MRETEAAPIRGCSAPTMRWEWVKDEKGQEVAIGERRGVKFRLVRPNYPERTTAHVQRWELSRWVTVARWRPDGRYGGARSWRCLSRAQAAVERGDCDG